MRRASVTFLLTVLCAAAWPAENPRCEVRSGEPGAPAIVLDGQPYSPILFMGNNFREDYDVVLSEVKHAAGAGIQLFSFCLWPDWHRSAEETAETVDRFCQANPEGYFYVRIWLGPNGQWASEHPDECIKKADGTVTRWASVASEVWREEAARQLRGRLREILDGPHGDRFIGVCPTYLQTGEWFYTDTNDFMDYSEANLRTFRIWLKTAYRNEKQLQEVWANMDVTFDTAQFPTPEDREAAVWGPFRSLSKNRPAIDMHRFQSETMAETIEYFARVAKKATDDRSLVGVFYGYTVELNGNGPRALAHSGHLASHNLLACDDIDIIHAPYSYFERALGEPGHLHLAVDSLALHHKLGIFEDDTFTHLSQGPEGDLITPGWKDRTTNLEETLAVNRRNFANYFTHRCGIWIFDLLGDGRWNDAGFWDSMPLLRRMAAEVRSQPLFEPEVAWVVDEVSVALMQSNTQPYLIHALYWARAELSRLGAPVGQYLLSDIGLIPDSVRVLILPNALQLDEPTRDEIRRRLEAGCTVIWMYAPGLFVGADPSVDGMKATTEIAVEARFDDVPMTLASEWTPDWFEMDPASWQPRFVVTDEHAMTLARYEETGEPCVAATFVGEGLSIYSAFPRLPVGLLREICARSGVFFYRDTPGMTGVVGNYLVVHTGEAASHEFHWPTICEKVERLVPGSLAFGYENVSDWTNALPAGTTAVYRCQPLEKDENQGYHAPNVVSGPLTKTGAH